MQKELNDGEFCKDLKDQIATLQKTIEFKNNFIQNQKQTITKLETQVENEKRRHSVINNEIIRSNIKYQKDLSESNRRNLNLVQQKEDLAFLVNKYEKKNIKLQSMTQVVEALKTTSSTKPKKQVKAGQKLPEKQVKREEIVQEKAVQTEQKVPEKQIPLERKVQEKQDNIVVYREPIFSDKIVDDVTFYPEPNIRKKRKISKKEISLLTKEAKTSEPQVPPAALSPLNSLIIPNCYTPPEKPKNFLNRRLSIRAKGTQNYSEPSLKKKMRNSLIQEDKENYQNL